MSTKTNFKRVALVAVAALGLGVLTSVAPANAVPGALTVNAASVGICANDSGPLTTIAMSKTGSLVIAVAASASTDTVKTSGVLNITGFATIGGAIAVDQKKFTASDTNAGTVTFTPSGAGAATIYSQTGGTGANVQTVSVTVVDSCAGAAVANAANSFIQVIDTLGDSQAASALGTTTKVDMTQSADTRTYDQVLDNSVDYSTSFANAATAYVNVTARDAYKLPLAGTSYYYGIACTGDVSVNGGSTNGGFIAGVAAEYTAQFSVAQNTLNAGVNTTCTVTVNNIVLGTKSIAIKGDLAKIEASLRTVGASGTAAGDATAGTISYKYFDAAGNRLATTGTGLGDPSLTATGSALINAISSVTPTTATTTGRLSYNCVDSTASGDVSLVIKRTNAAGATISAPAFKASCGGALDTYSASLDKATYNTGDIATLTIKGLDDNGKIVNDAVTAGAGAAITISGMTAVTAPATTDLFVGGALVYTFKVDNEAGNYVASAYLPSAGTQTAASTVKVTVGSQGVSNADVLKAIVSLIASINKQIAALQKALLKR
jgi:hypothetical protein